MFDIKNEEITLKYLLLRELLITKLTPNIIVGIGLSPLLNFQFPVSPHNSRLSLR